jgi:hypothetical protein
MEHTFMAKQPGPRMCVQPVTMAFRYDAAFGLDNLPKGVIAPFPKIRVQKVPFPKV